MGKFAELRDATSDRLAKSYSKLLNQMFSIIDADLSEDILKGDQNKLKPVIEGKKLAVETVKLVMGELTLYDDNESYGGSDKSDFKEGIPEKFARANKK